MNYKIKVITGFRRDQFHTIDAEEAHKAYYLFLHPDQRGIFKNGVALLGADIRGIEPDYQGTMGWNPTHVLDSDDWNELHGRGVSYALRDVLTLARDVAQLARPEQMNLSLSEAAKSLAPAFEAQATKLLPN